MGIFIRDYERIVGYQTADPNRLNRIGNHLDDWRTVPRARPCWMRTGRRELNKLCKYWKGETFSDRHQATIPDELKKHWTYEGTFLWSQLSELGISNYEKLFKLGLNGLIQEIKDKIAEVDKEIPGNYVEQKDFLAAAIIALAAVINFAKRNAGLARNSADRQISKLKELSNKRVWPYPSAINTGIDT